MSRTVEIASLNSKSCMSATQPWLARSWSVDRFSMRCDTTGCHFTTACPVSFRSFNVFKSVHNRNATNLVAGISVLVRSLVAIHQNMTTRPNNICMTHFKNNSGTAKSKHWSSWNVLKPNWSYLYLLLTDIRSLPSNSLKQRLGPPKNPNYTVQEFIKMLSTCIHLLLSFYLCFVSATEISDTKGYPVINHRWQHFTTLIYCRKNKTNVIT